MIDCAFMLLSLCIDPSNIYVNGMIYQPLYTGRNEGRYCWDHWCRGSMTEARLGLLMPINRNLEFDIGIRHTSFIEETDRGEESGYLSITFRPFR